MNKFFIADTHYGHGNIIKFCNRPFLNVKEMNEALIKNWNSIVSENDEVYHLGDVAMKNPLIAKQFLESVNGKIYLIKGNHEQSVLKKESNIKRFEWVKDYYELDLSFKQKMVMFHYPIASWNKCHHGAMMLHGHCHNSYNGNGKIMDVGVDNPIVNFAPINIDTIIKIMDEKKFTPVDHHM